MSERDDDAIEAIDGFFGWSAPGLPPSHEPVITTVVEEALGFGCHFTYPLTNDQEAFVRQSLCQQLERHRQYLAGVEADLREGVSPDIGHKLRERQEAWLARGGRLEQLLRPGVLSGGGFLGRGERLDDVLKRDAETLAALGVEPALVARRIREVVDAALGRYHVYLKTFATAPEKIDPKEGCAVEFFWVSWSQWRGFQSCPWGCDDEPGWGSIDFRIENRRTGASFKGPGLITHLIEQHGFFEGVESPYRVDPKQAVDVLELGPVMPPK